MIGQVEAFIQALKQKTGSSSDEQLASALQIGKSTIASWRIRDTVPAKIKRFALENYQIDFDNFELKNQNPPEVIEFLTSSAEMLAVLQLAKSINSDELVEYALWLGEHRARLRQVLTEGLYFEAVSSDNARIFTRLLTDVIEGKRATPSVLKALKAADDRLSTAPLGSEFRTEFRTDLDAETPIRAGSALKDEKKVS